MNEMRLNIAYKLLILALSLLLIVVVECAENGTKAEQYVAEVVVVDLDKCNYKPDNEKFYKGIAANQEQRAKVPKSSMSSECWTRCRVHYQMTPNLKHCNIGNGLSVGIGANKAYSNARLYEELPGCDSNKGRWVWMDVPKDVREIPAKDYVVSVTAQNGIGQIYIPLLTARDSPLTNGQAYMIRITNDYNLWNGGGKYNWQLGDVEAWNAGWAGGTAVYRRIDMNVSCILQHVDDNFSADVRGCMTPYVETRPTVDWNDRNLMELKRGGYTTSQLCGFASRPKDITWMTIVGSIVKHYSYLNGLWPGFTREEDVHDNQE